MSEAKATITIKRDLWLKLIELKTTLSLKWGRRATWDDVIEYLLSLFYSTSM